MRSSEVGKQSLRMYNVNPGCYYALITARAICITCMDKLSSSLLLYVHGMAFLILVLTMPCSSMRD